MESYDGLSAVRDALDEAVNCVMQADKKVPIDIFRLVLPMILVIHWN